MQRRHFLQSAATLTLGSLRNPASAFLPESKPAKKPNILYVLTDEWRAQAFGYAGDVNAHTPAFDSFARESANFTNMISGLPLCCPARASFVTGQYPLKHGVFINDVELKPNDLTIGQVFKKAGYRTGYIGKWHLYGSPDGHYGRRAAPIPADHHFGFDYWKASECDHNYNHERYYEGSDPTPRYWPGYSPASETDDACRFIESASKQPEPFFLVLSMTPPHFPYGTAPESYRNLYAGKDIALRPNVPAASSSKAVPDLRGYYAHGAALDDCFMRLLATLDKLNLSDDTIVVFTADHGDMLHSQGLEHKLFPWDESLRIPFLLRYPRKLGRASRQVDAPINVPDIMPTLLGLCGISIPPRVQGSNYARLLLADDTTGLQASAYINNPASTFQLRECGFDICRNLRSRTHTYVRSIHGPWLLDDNLADPYQMLNILNNPESNAVQAS